MEVTAKLRRLRMAPRKVRLVAGLVRRMPVRQAETQLKFLNKAAARPVLKLLQSAIANAENNFKLNADDLWINHLTVDGGMTIKRFRPRAHGRAGMIRKRTSHITLILTDAKREPVKIKKSYTPRSTKKVVNNKAAKPEVKSAKTENTES